MDLYEILDKNRNVIATINTIERRKLSKRFALYPTGKMPCKRLIARDKREEVFEAIANIRGIGHDD